MLLALALALGPVGPPTHPAVTEHRPFASDHASTAYAYADKAGYHFRQVFTESLWVMEIDCADAAPCTMRMSENPDHFPYLQTKADRPSVELDREGMAEIEKEARTALIRRVDALVAAHARDKAMAREIRDMQALTKPRTTIQKKTVQPSRATEFDKDKPGDPPPAKKAYEASFYQMREVRAKVRHFNAPNGMLIEWQTPVFEGKEFTDIFKCPPAPAKCLAYYVRTEDLGWEDDRPPDVPAKKLVPGQERQRFQLVPNLTHTLIIERNQAPKDIQ